MTGPYETEQQVRELPAVRAVYDAMHASHRCGVMGELGYPLLDEACEAASVKVGAYDHRILIWLAGFEPETCAVVAGLITRAHQAGTAVTGEPPVTLTAAQAASSSAKLPWAGSRFASVGTGSALASLTVDSEPPLLAGSYGTHVATASP